MHFQAHRRAAAGLIVSEVLLILSFFLCRVSSRCVLSRLVLALHLLFSFQRSIFFFFFFVNLPPVHPLLLHAPCELCPLSLNPQHRPKYNLKTINNNEGMLRLSSELQTLQTKKKTSKENMTEKQSGGFTHVDISDFTVRQSSGRVQRSSHSFV